MNTTKIAVQATVAADKKKVWDYYTNPKHITRWNFADPSWHCPTASNDLQIGGRYIARMEAKDGSFGFDFEAVYTEILIEEKFTYEFGGRFSTVEFKDTIGQTEITVTFDPENENSIDLQRQGWQAILDNFKSYTEANKTMKITPEHNERMAKMTFASVYPQYVTKVERKGRTKEELNQVIKWLTSFDENKIQELIDKNVTLEEFFKSAKLNQNHYLITGVICGYRIEEIENPLTRSVRYLDKLVDELAKGKKMENILRTE